MKKLVISLVVVCLAFGFVGCSSNQITVKSGKITVKCKVTAK